MAGLSQNGCAFKVWLSWVQLRAVCDYLCPLKVARLVAINDTRVARRPHRRTIACQNLPLFLRPLWSQSVFWTCSKPDFSNARPPAFTCDFASGPTTCRTFIVRSLAFTYDNLSQPSLTCRKPSVTDTLEKSFMLYALCFMSCDLLRTARLAIRSWS